MNDNNHQTKTVEDLKPGGQKEEQAPAPAEEVEDKLIGDDRIMEEAARPLKEAIKKEEEKSDY